MNTLDRFPILKSVAHITIAYYTVVVIIAALPAFIPMAATLVLIHYSALSGWMQVILFLPQLVFLIYSGYVGFNKIHRMSSAYQVVYWSSTVISSFFLIFNGWFEKLTNDIVFPILSDAIPLHIKIVSIVYLTIFTIISVKKPMW